MYNILKRISLIVLTAGLLLAGCGKKTEPAAVAVRETAPAAVLPQARTDLQIILVAGIDTFDLSESTGAFRNENRADFLMLMITDEAEESIFALQLNPDTLVDFKVPGTSESLRLPLGRVFSYGSGGSDSCLNLKDAVSGLLCNVRIDHYMTFTLDSIAIVNDMLGGVTVSGTGEIPGISQEEKLSLTGSDAVIFFRYRAQSDVSNSEHMERQQQYMLRMLEPFSQNAQKEDFLTRLTLKLGDALATDLTLTQMLQMMQSLGNFHMEQTVVTIPGTAAETGAGYEFTVDEQSLSQIVERLFFE